MYWIDQIDSRDERQMEDTLEREKTECEREKREKERVELTSLTWISPTKAARYYYSFFPRQGSRISVPYSRGDVYVNDLHE